MSIYVFITRRREPADENAVPISSAEWLAVASEETDFREATGAEMEWSGPFMRVWVGHPQNAVHFDWVDDQVEVRNPDERIIVRMKALAKTLNATVFSETGEVYDDHGESAGFLDGYP